MFLLIVMRLFLLVCFVWVILEFLVLFQQSLISDESNLEILLAIILIFRCSKDFIMSSILVWIHTLWRILSSHSLRMLLSFLNLLDTHTSKHV